MPVGDKFYRSNESLIELNIFYQETKYGYPWIVLGEAINQESYLEQLLDDELQDLKPVGEPKNVSAILITENDFDMSQIQNYNIEDCRDTNND